MRSLLYGKTRLEKNERQDRQTYLLSGIEQMWEKITLEKYEGGLPASLGAEMGAVAQWASTFPGTHAFAIWFLKVQIFLKDVGRRGEGRALDSSEIPFEF